MALFASHGFAAYDRRAPCIACHVCLHFGQQTNSHIVISQIDTFGIGSFRQEQIGRRIDSRMRLTTVFAAS